MGPLPHLRPISSCAEVWDCAGNRIARLELLTSIAGLAAGIAAAVSGFFGMNLVREGDGAKRPKA